LAASDAILAPLAGDLCKILQTNFYEKALFVKGDVATALWPTQRLLCLSRYASIRTLGESALW
jgi:hypothetical protein